LKLIQLSAYTWLLCLFSFTACDSSGPSIESFIDSSWTTVKPSDHKAPSARHEAGLIAVGGRIFLIGGRGRKPVDIWDAKTKTWTEGSYPPFEIHHFQPVAYGEIIYIIGAMTGPYPYEKPVDHILIYDTSTDQWSLGPEIPANRKRGSAGAVLVGEEIYLVCGIKNGHIGDHKKWMDKYNIKTQEWTILSDAPRERDHFQAAHIEGKIYAVSGRTTRALDNPFKNTIKQVDIYDVNTDTWSVGPQPIPTERAGASVISVDGHVIVCGGESYDQVKAHDEVEAMNVENLLWKSLPNLPTGRHGTGLCLVNRKLYTCSGAPHRGGSYELDDILVLE